MADKVDVYKVSNHGTFDRRTTEIDGRFPGLYILSPREKSVLNNGGEQGRAYNANMTSLVDLTNARRLDTWEEVEEFRPDHSQRLPVKRWGCVVSDYSMNPVAIEEGEAKEKASQSAMSQATQLGLLASLAEASAAAKDRGWQPTVMKIMAFSVLALIVIWGVLLFQEQSVRNRINQFGEQYQVFDQPIQGLTGGLIGGEEAPAAPAATETPPTTDAETNVGETATPEPTPSGPQELQPSADET